MRIKLIGTGIVLVVLGGVWVTQGIGALKGSFMTGSSLWGWIGATCIAAGLVLAILGIRSGGRRATGSPRSLSVFSGLVSVGVAVGVGQLSAGIVGPATSPVVVVGQAAIDATPGWLKDFAIRTFGAQDKIALVIGIGLVIAVIAVTLGWANLRHPLAGPVGIVGFSLLALVAALTRPAAHLTDALPAIAGSITGVLCIRRLRGYLEPSGSTLAPDITAEASVAEFPGGYDRRRFLRASGYGVGIAVLAGGLGRLIASRSAATASRSAVKLPGPASPLPLPATGTDLNIPGLSPFITPNDRFYRVDTSILAPQVTTDDWTLRIHGMVEKEMTLNYKDLLALPVVERDITLCCVSNPVGGSYISNARWLGALLKPILEEAGVSPQSTQIVTTSVDGFTIGTPTVAVMDGRDAMLAVGMNGDPLPIGHGFPVRMIVPGLFGYVSAMKWIKDMELTTFEAFDAYWIERGWAQQATIITESRIDTPRGGASLKAGEIAVAGVAWAQHTGIEAVDVQVDDGPFVPAQLSAQDTIDTWRQWLYRWDATPGSHTLKVRATDRSGYTQTSQVAQPAPKGATGLHSIAVQVS